MVADNVIQGMSMEEPSFYTSTTFPKELRKKTNSTIGLLGQKGAVPGKVNFSAASTS